MYSFILMLQDWRLTGNIHWFAVFYLFILVRWAVVFSQSLRYKAYSCEDKKYYVSVIIPVLDEPIPIFTSVLSKIIEQRPDEIIVAVNGPENPELMRAVEDLKAAWEKDPDLSQVVVKALYTPELGKRNAIQMGMEHIHEKSDITVLVDSDAFWTEDTLKNLLKPFSADESIGGVTTRQKIYNPDRKLVTMIAGILEEIRAEGTMKAMSATGKVGCLPGRTIAFRTEILRKAMPEFMTETFLGIHKEVSDDRSLTNITLKMGYKTVMQDSSVVYTDAPETWKKFARQQLRWAEGSQYNNIRMTGWMLRNARLMLFIYWSDMLMPFLMISVYTNIGLCCLLKAAGYYIATITYAQSFMSICALIVLGTIVGFGLRNIKSFIKMPQYYILIIPVLTLLLSFFMVPIRVIGLMKCADGLPWGTRGIESSGVSP